MSDTRQEILVGHFIKAWTEFQGEEYIDDDTPEGEVEYLHSSMNWGLVGEVIQHALIDMDRMTAFHLVRDEQSKASLPDHHKYAGFIAKWTSKIRPIQVWSDFAHANQPKNTHTLNSRFSTYIFRSFLRHPIPSKLVDYFDYVFHFRSESGETLALVAYLCEQVAEAGGNTLDHIATPPF